MIKSYYLPIVVMIVLLDNCQLLAMTDEESGTSTEITPYSQMLGVNSKKHKEDRSRAFYALWNSANKQQKEAYEKAIKDHDMTKLKYDLTVALAPVKRRTLPCEGKKLNNND